MRQILNRIRIFFQFDNHLSLENRLYFSSLLAGIVLCLLGGFVAFLVSPMAGVILTCLVLALVLFIIYYLGRSKGLIQPFKVPIVIISFLSIFYIWVKGGGIDSPNIFPNFVVLILGLIIVPPDVRKYILLVFLGLVGIEFYIQLYFPQLIEKYPSEFARWADGLFTSVYSAVFVYFIIINLHNNYTRERKRAEENELKFKMLYDRSPDMYYSVSPVGATILNCNETFLSTLGYSREEVIGKPIFTFMDSSVIAYAYENFKRFLETGSVKNKEFTILKKNGEKIIVSLNAEAVRDVDNKILYSISSWRDITDQKLGEQKLKNSNELLSLFIQQSPIYAFIKTVTLTDSRILYASDNYVNMVGIKGSDMIGKSVLDIFPEEFAREIQKEDWKVVLNGEILRVEQKFNSRIYSTVKFPIKQDGKNLLAGYSVDITDIVGSSLTIQEQNRELQKLNADKDIFISILAHDLKNPFNALLGFSTLLVENVRKYNIDRIESQLKLINENSRRAYNLLEDILFWSQAQSGKIPFEPVQVNFRELCAEVIDNIRLSAINKNIKIEINVLDIELFADKNMLTTIMRNLLTNAIKFTNYNGNISVTSSVSDQFVVVAVNDDGIGMDANHVAELFDFTRKVTTRGTEGEAGTGFGLLLCKEFVGKHGGKIWVESELNKGSSFRFSVPMWLNIAATA